MVSVWPIDYFNYLRKNLEEIHGEKPLFGTDEDLELQYALIEGQLARLRVSLKRERTK